MPICPNCGRVESEGAIFCEACGTMLKARPAAADAPLEPPLISKLRKIGGSGIMLILAVILSVNAALELLSTGFNLLNGSFRFPLIPVIFTIAAWSVYSTCKKPVGTLISSGGITTVRVIKIIQLVLFCFAALLFLLLTGIFCVVFSSNSFAELRNLPDTIKTVGIAVLTAAVFECVFCIFQCIFAARFYGSVTDTLKSGFPYCKSARTYGIFTMITGIYRTLLSAALIVFLPVLTSFKNQLEIRLYSAISNAEFRGILLSALYGNAFTAVSGEIISVVSAAAGIIFGISLIIVALLVFRYRRAVTEQV